MDPLFDDVALDRIDLDALLFQALDRAFDLFRITHELKIGFEIDDERKAENQLQTDDHLIQVKIVLEAAFLASPKTSDESIDRTQPCTFSQSVFDCFNEGNRLSDLRVRAQRSVGATSSPRSITTVKTRVTNRRLHQ